MRDPDEENELPEGVTQEMVEALVRRVVEACEKIGLYASDTIQVESHSGRLVVLANFQVGDIAFSQRVQNPEQDAFDDQFRAIEADSVADQAEDIRNKFKRDDTSDGG